MRNTMRVHTRLLTTLAGVLATATLINAQYKMTVSQD